MTLETGLSDFHKVILTVMKVFYKKQKPIIITYRSYKHFSNLVSMADVQNRISQVASENNELEFDIFETYLMKLFKDTLPQNSDMLVQIKLLS